jgi:hypothetical protein
MKADLRKRIRSRAYGARHRQLRRALAPLVAAGGVNCARCGEPIEPGTPWDLGHTDDGLGYSGPEHARCNRGAPHRNVTSREW